MLCKVTEWYSDYIQDIQGLFWPRFLRNETLTLGSDGIWPKIKFELLFLVQQCKKSCQGVRLFLIYVLGSQAAAWLIHTQHESESGFFILVFTPNGEIQFHLWQSWLVVVMFILQTTALLVIYFSFWSIWLCSLC